MMAHIAQRREVRRQRCIIERVVLRMTNASKFASFERWRQTITEKKAMEAMSTKVVLRWKLQMVVRCFGTWSELTADEVQKRDLMREIVRRMLHRNLSFAMDLWQQNVSAARQEENKRGKSILSRMARRGVGDADGADGDQVSATLEDLADVSGQGSEKTNLKRKRTAYQYLKLRLKALANFLKRRHIVRDSTEH